MQYWNNTISIFLFFILFSFTFSAQAQENSPYSRYGLGNIRAIDNIANRGMGGVVLADENAQIVNPANPATYTGLKLASYQVGIASHLVTIKSATTSNKVGNTVLSYINIGFPVSKKMGISFGLLPVTSARYNMQTKIYNAGIQSEVLNSYYGGGGIQKIYVGAAYKIKDFSLGFNTGYTFGNIVNTSESEFTDSLKILSNNITGRTTMGGVFWQLGALMNKELNADYRLKAGVTYTGAQNLNAKKESYWESFIGDVENPIYVEKVDSVVGLKGKIKVPFNMGVGLMLAHGDHWQIGADYQYANWKSYTAFGSADSMDNTWTIRIGGSIIPDPNSVNNYWKRMAFRLGFYTGKDIFNFNGTHISFTAATAGLGYPIRRTNRSIGQINAAVEVGSRGTTGNGLLKENFTRISIGFTFNDVWFLKRRYD